MGQYKKILRILAACLSMVLFFSALSLSAGAWEAPDWRRYGYMVDVPEEVLEHASASLEDLGQIIEWMENVK